MKPGDSHLRPFTDFLVEKIGNSIPGLWPAKDSLQIITNIENLQGVELTAQNETVRLTGLNGLDLDKDEYVGIYFGNIERMGCIWTSSRKLCDQDGNTSSYFYRSQY